MRFNSIFYAQAALICLSALATPAQAGQMFPPINVGAAVNSCPSGMVLGWAPDQAGSGSVYCVNPTPGVTVSCPAGQVSVMTGIQSGTASCVPLPASCDTTNSFLTYVPPRGTAAYGSFTCSSLVLPVCVAPSFLTSNDGRTFTCSGPVCTPNWTNTTVGACSAPCGGGEQSVDQSDGCGHTQNIRQACNTQTCAPPSTSVHISCGISACWPQLLLVTENGTTQQWDFSAYRVCGSNNVNTVTVDANLPSPPTTGDVQVQYVSPGGVGNSNQIFSPNGSGNGFTVYTDDGHGDGDFNDAVCTFSW